MLEDFEQAERYYDQMQDTSYDIGYVYYQLGKTEEAEKIFSEEIQKLQSNLDEENGLNYLELASIYAFQGDRDKALANLAEYAKQGFTFGYQDFILIDPFFESLRDDPEFKSIVKQAQQEKAALRNQVREMEERGELTLWCSSEWPLLAEAVWKLKTTFLNRF